MDDNSPLFDFERKVNTFIDLLDKQGVKISQQDYVKACVANPPLFYQNPQTTLLNLIGKGMVGTKERIGFLTLLKEKHGIDLPLERYVKACLAQPSLFQQDPQTILLNLIGKGIVGTRERIGFVTLIKEKHGIDLPLERYVKACLAQPSLFQQDPQTILLNLIGKGIVGTEERTGFITLLKEKHGIDLPLERYVEACLLQSSLFSRNPQTVLEHFSIILGIAENLRKAGHAFPKPIKNDPLKENDLLLDRLLKSPIILSLSEDNLWLRGLYALQKYPGNGEAIPFGIFKKPRKHVASTVIETLGKEAEAGKYVLDALIHAGILTEKDFKPPFRQL